MPDIYFKDRAINLPGIRRYLAERGLATVRVDTYPSDYDEYRIVIKGAPLGSGLRVYEQAIDTAKKEYKRKVKKER